jgi:hypothetical protein
MSQLNNHRSLRHGKHLRPVDATVIALDVQSAANVEALVLGAPAELRAELLELLKDAAGGAADQADHADPVDSSAKLYWEYRYMRWKRLQAVVAKLSSTQ